jgi:5-methylcytosine-specific restriction endonuclease McrA
MAQQINNGEWQSYWKPTKQEKKQPKYIKQAGKVAQTWAKVKAQYLKDHPADYRGYRTCQICGGQVHESEVEVDHVINRSLRPDLRYEDSNLQVCHASCNAQKKLGH